MNKNVLTNIFAVALVIATSGNAYLESLCATCEVNLVTLAIGVVGAIAMFFIGTKKGGEG